MAKVNIFNVKRALIATVEQREHQWNAMENPQLSTIRNRLHKIICLIPYSTRTLKQKLRKIF